MDVVIYVPGPACRAVVVTTALTVATAVTVVAVALGAGNALTVWKGTGSAVSVIEIPAVRIAVLLARGLENWAKATVGSYWLLVITTEIQYRGNLRSSCIYASYPNWSNEEQKAKSGPAGIWQIGKERNI